MKSKKANTKKTMPKKTTKNGIIDLEEVLKTVDPSSSKHKTNLSRFNFKIGELNSERLTNYASKLTRGS